jgi:UDP-2,3-diacylglucosamine hydrolase
MSHKQVIIKEGAFLISDAHYSELRPELLTLIEEIHSKKLLPTQLILMGDIFDALFGEVAYTQKKNRKMIRLLNEISRMIEVIYLEGNHDFNITSYFDKIKVFPIASQPVTCFYKEHKVCLAHGDFDGDTAYKLYTRLIRNRLLVKVLTFVDTLMGHKILKKLDTYLAQKEDCKEFIGFQDFVSSRLFYRGALSSKQEL